MVGRTREGSVSKETVKWQSQQVLLRKLDSVMKGRKVKEDAETRGVEIRGSDGIHRD